MDTKKFSTGESMTGEGETISIRSFTKPDVDYEVTDTSCECPHSRIQGAMCRHRLLFGVLQRIRKSPFSVRRDEETAREIVAKVLDRRNGYPESYSAAMEAEFFRFGTPELRRVAWTRHAANVRRVVA